MAKYEKLQRKVVDLNSVEITISIGAKDFAALGEDEAFDLADAIEIDLEEMLLSVLRAVVKKHNRGRELSLSYGIR